MSDTLTMSQVTSFIATHTSEDDLARIQEVVKERRKALANAAAAAVTTGALVEVVNIRPADFKGKRGTVQAIIGRSASITFDEESTKELRWSARSRKINVPDNVEQWTPETLFPLICLRVIR
ncbi:hypothetical protein HUT19_41185 [Streptomyces sp. NA02950]|uniref:hypothetical protein n=1 Tax=Streptomyces sp. NA02950 TaxID=2742137 RepID=UPI001592AB9E|nr:hypothetical protein [Streptomyces sp. NA02950]QKV90371.1 hypothetical protein HUT19_00035 [Streptomyces sp. NA02950]QKV97296.1 hypothetical protein HUT19_41185 [Streptomyces sp. NA02950]